MKAETHIDIAALRQANLLPEIAAGIVALTRQGNEWKGCCPFHPDRSPSFTVFAEGQRFHCFGCGAGGDVLDFLQRLHGIGLREAAAILASRNLPAVQLAPAPLDERSDRIAEARAIWRVAMPVQGTPAETYLRARGLHLPIPASIRYARLRYGKHGREYPALIAAVASADHHLAGIQRTYLSSCGTAKAPVPKPKLSLGRVACGAIRLAPPARRLFVTEGLEDGLTLMQDHGCAVWVACGASMLPRMIFPAGVEEVIVGGDNDAAGREAALRAVATYRARGIRSRAIFPVGAKDFNAELMEGRGL
ncbi:CHC2 zinc finger domain-containing protein [Novosphingobium sp.]|uniref:DUF7146 domain-containing protein n=1 Tax=Novosphingobium sp. TaxID=1874826 RepID=UPI001DDB26A6|nr:CHC2 zinc finger domain-containing protein [Novosphingobium sp.]MBX9665917.1 toprim domain-containing protein [Novosphingobium sp.]